MKVHKEVILWMASFLYNEEMKKKHTRRNFIFAVLILTIAYWAGINMLVSAVLVPSFMERLHAFDRIVEQSYAEQVQETSLQNNAVSMTVIGINWARNMGPEEVSILSKDGYRLRGALFAQDMETKEAETDAALAEGAETDRGADLVEETADPSAAHNWVILLHGYTGSKEMMYGFAYWYWQRGCNILAPDFRCQGESEGDYIGLGATDSEDLLGWIDLILQRDPDAKIVLHGLSMGASTALILSGKEDIPSNVTAIISDCAYTDAYAMFREKIGSWFHLPAFPVIDSAELMIRLRAGYDLKETSPLAAVGNSRIPTLFIHGTEDRMIPVKMCLLLYNAAVCDKEIMIVDRAGHAQAAEKDPVRYFDTVAQFLSKYAE